MTVAWTRVVAVEVIKNCLDPGPILKSELTEFADQLVGHRVREKKKDEGKVFGLRSCVSSSVIY